MEGALAYLENDMLSLSRLDDICLDLSMAPDERGEVRAPAWLYEGVLCDLARNGLGGKGGILTDDMLAKSVNRVWQRHDARIAALNKAGTPASWEMVPEVDPDVNPDINLWAQKGRDQYKREINPYIEEVIDKTLVAYRENPLLYDKGAHYYQVFRRPLKGLEYIFIDNPLLDNNIRTEHQHL